MADEERSTEGRSRRRLLTLGAATAGAIAATAITTGRAAAHGTAHFDGATSDPAVHGNNTSDGPGVQGDSATGNGVYGHTYRFVPGRRGPWGNRRHRSQRLRRLRQQRRRGCRRRGSECVRLRGRGDEPLWVGVAAGSLYGIAFDGFAPAGIAVARLGGKVRLSTVGSGMIPAGSRELTVPNGQVTD